MAEREFIVTYRLIAASADDAARVSREIALEQTVELPEGAFSAAIEANVVPCRRRLEPVGDGFELDLAFDEALIAGEPTQLLNLLFGNISLKRGIRIQRVEPSSIFAKMFPGPAYGVSGWRDLCQVRRRRPLLCTALKPVGLKAQELADLCRKMAEGDADLVKDDHGLTDQSSAPFRERVRRCQNAVSGFRTRYVPNITASPAETLRRLEFAVDHGCRAVMVSPLLCGIDTLIDVARTGRVAILAHPALSGAYFSADHGIAPEVLLGDIVRRCGADGVIYPEAGGRFPLTEEDCSRLRDSLREEKQDVKPSMPVPGGGLRINGVQDRIDANGPDTIYLVGGSLHDDNDVARSTRGVMEALRASA
ncbi:MAG: RuBisCO large subunit C-terminal-like domain-containing protein [Acidobacteriota bacterium]|nr:RuBisCO large subunit C-terminal-like domain-containing protein [Acidobacteriota bacterium]MDH3784062.1 RuBisCO large subunit C-terminal-like domain-containing protein [Acidobacteriota bacterium]